jgi:uncharacterized membrane protein
MNRSLLIASAVAAVLAGSAMVTKSRADSQRDEPMDEKCYGVSAKDISACGSDASTCAYHTGSQQASNVPSQQTTGGKEGGEEWAVVPKGTCVKIYGGSLWPKKTS